MAISRFRWLGENGSTAGFNFGATILAAVTGVLLARWLGPTGRGNYAAITAYFGLLLVITGLGTGSSVVYFTSRERSEADSYVRTATAMLVPLAVIGVAATILIAEFGLNGEDPRRTPLLVLVACIIASLIGSVRIFALQSLSIAKWNLIRLVQPATMLILVAGYWAFRPITVTAVIALFAISLSAQSTLSWFLYSRQTILRGRYSRSKVLPLTTYGLASVASIAPNSINASFDQLVLATTVAPALLGQYAVAVTLSLLIGPLALAFGYVAFPRLARGGDSEHAISQALRGSFLVSTIGVATIVASSPVVVPTLFGHGYSEVPKLLLALAPGAVFFIVNQVIGDLLRGLGRPGLTARCELVGLACTLIGLFILVPRFGAYGAAFTSSFVYFIVHILLRIYLHKERSKRVLDVARGL